MSFVRPPRAYVYGILATVIACLFAALPAQSRSTTRDDRMAACATRVQELEAEVVALREQMRRLSGSQSHALSPQPELTNLHRRAGAPARTAVPQHADSAPDDSCDPPFTYDGRGIKSYKPNCLLFEGTPSTCAIPYEFTTAGIKIYKPGCLEMAQPLVLCDPPFSFDARGVKNFKRECVK